MEQKSKEMTAQKRLAPAGALFALAGIALFAYFVWKAGPADIWANISNIGWGFAAILLLAGLRFAVRAFAWTLCFERPHRLSFREAFAAYLVGDTAGNVVPLGLVVSEPTKIAMVRERVPVLAAVSSLAVENIFYMLSVSLFLLSGAAALLVSFNLPKVLRWSSYGIVAGALVFMGFAALAVVRRWRVLSGAAGALASRGLRRESLARRRERLAAFEDRVYGFYGRAGSRVIPVLACEAAFHALGVAESYLTIWLISGSQPSLLSAFLLESINRVINVVFKFVPLRAGVDELGTGQLARILRFGETAGVTLAIVRKARTVFWMAVGVALLVRRGLSLRGVAEEARRAREEQQNAVGSLESEPRSLESGV